MSEMNIQLVVKDVTGNGAETILQTKLCFAVPLGGIHGVLGPTGSGKTELCQILAGVTDSFNGSVMMGERSLCADARCRKEWKKKVGYVPKFPVLDPDMTVEEILELMGRVRGVSSAKRERQITEAMRLTGISGVSRRLASNLTPAEEKKLCLAMALLGNPDLLLLDEPMMGLNDAERVEMRELLGMLGERKTVLLFSSDYDTVVPLSNTVVLLSSGQILATDAPEVLEARLAEQGEGSSLRELYMALCGASEEEVTEDDQGAEDTEEEDAE